MSKDFEQAYKELAQNEAPDLWDRIEAGLKNRSVPEEVKPVSDAKTDESVKEETQISSSGEKNIQEKIDKGKKKIWIFSNYYGMIAAAVCAMVILPAVILSRQSAKGYTSGGAEESAVAAESIEEAADTGAGNMASAEEEAVDEMTMLTDAGEGYDDAASSDTGAISDKVMAAENADMTERKDDALSQKSGAEASKNEAFNQSMDMMDTVEGAAEKKDGDVFEHVYIKVTEVKGNFYKEGEKEPGILCMAVLQQDLPHMLEGEQIMIYIPSSVRISLSNDEEYEVALEYQSGKTYSFILKEIYR